MSDRSKTTTVTARSVANRSAWIGKALASSRWASVDQTGINRFAHGTDSSTDPCRGGAGDERQSVRRYGDLKPVRLAQMNAGKGVLSGAAVAAFNGSC